MFLYYFFETFAHSCKGLILYECGTTLCEKIFSKKGLFYLTE
ncbi:hypothetical protein BREVNS_1265 [Brevinematales bacterium NS]|nr:hypothetical protein BREVNS_1265 [Brevinematales bacterium NS]